MIGKSKTILMLAVALVAASVCARTIRQSFSHQDVDNNVTVSKQSLSYVATGNHEQSEVITVATSETAFALSAGITGGEGPGIFTFYNESASNSVRVGIASGVYSMDVPAERGGIMWLHPSVTSLYFQAAGSSQELFRVYIFER